MGTGQVRWAIRFASRRRSLMMGFSSIHPPDRKDSLSGKNRLGRQTPNRGETVSQFLHSGLSRCFVAAVCGVFPAACQQIPLTVPAGTPLQLSIQKRVRIKKIGEPVKAVLVNPLFAFDTEVAPANSHVLGHVERLDPVSRQRRILSIMNGDFTPLRDPQIRFDILRLPDGKTVPLRTILTSGRGVVVHAEGKARRKGERKDTALGRVAESLKATLDSQTQELIRTIHAPDRWERLQEAGYERLPYHPQYLSAGTRISTELEQPLAFGTACLTAARISGLGVLPQGLVNAHLVSSLSSATSEAGSKIEAIVTQPSFAPDGQLLLPEGARLTGTVVRVTPARWLRRGGELRFTFQKIELPAFVNGGNREIEADGLLVGLDALRSSAVRIDSEGNTRSYEPRTRFLAPAVKLFLGAQVLDNDRNSNGQTTSKGRTMRVLAGASGFGVLGGVAAQFSHDAATSLGFYGAAWSVFTHVVARGHDVVIGPDTPLQVRFEAPR
jgi:hypothetical protein